jgi:hypothetical protein
VPLKVTDEQFLDAVTTSRNWPEVVSRLGVIDLRSVMYRRRRFEAQYGVRLAPGRAASKHVWHPQAFQHQSDAPYDAVLFGDSHVWPGQFETPAYKALLMVAQDIRPRVCVDMGDSIDGATISRFPRIGWEQRPTLKQELDANREFRGRIDRVLPKDCRKIWLLGNHDLRWMGRLSNEVPEFEGIEGTDLSTMFPGWNFAKSLVLNDTLLCLHRFTSGVHAGYNNSLRSGVSVATGHDHKLEALPLTDFRGLRFGIRTGTLANIYGPQFEYTENQPVDWCQGFVVVHIDGTRIWPEPVIVAVNEFRFRGKTYPLE